MKESHPNQYSLKEGLKEVGRYLIFGVLMEIVTVVVPVVILGINTATGTIAINWQLVYAVGLTTLLTALLRGVDKFTHARNKILFPERTGESQGLLPF